MGIATASAVWKKLSADHGPVRQLCAVGVDQPTRRLNGGLRVLALVLVDDADLVVGAHLVDRPRICSRASSGLLARLTELRESGGQRFPGGGGLLFRGGGLLARRGGLLDVVVSSEVVVPSEGVVTSGVWTLRRGVLAEGELVADHQVELRGAVTPPPSPPHAARPRASARQAPTTIAPLMLGGPFRDVFIAAGSRVRRMATVQAEGIEGLKALQGRRIGPTEWREVTQRDIDDFACLSGDDQWIHVDVERAKKESLVRDHDRPREPDPVDDRRAPPRPDQLHRVQARSELRLEPGPLPAPVPAGSRIRASAEVTEFEDVGGGRQVVTRFTVDVEGSNAGLRRGLGRPSPPRIATSRR